MARHLVIGGDGLVGRHLVAALGLAGEEVWQTTRRPGGADPRRLNLDLAQGVGDWRPPVGMECAYLLAAVASVARCRQEPQACRAVNVDHALGLAKTLADQGAFLLLLSTSLVFSGKKPLPEPGDAVDPPTEYGRQKAEAEAGLLALGGRVVVLRVTKIIQPGWPLLGGWVEDLRAGRAIHPFHDMVMAPVGLDVTVRALQELARERRDGLWHLSASRDISYAQAAQHLARRLGADPGLVQPVSRSTAGILADDAPPATALGMVLTSQALGWRPPAPEEALDLALEGLITKS